MNALYPSRIFKPIGRYRFVLWTNVKAQLGTDFPGMILVQPAKRHQNPTPRGYIEGGW